MNRKMSPMLLQFTALLAVIITLTSCHAAPVRTEPLDLTGDLKVHDPAIIKENDTYYVFSTGGRRRGGMLPIRSSNDLHSWSFCANVFEELPDWVNQEVTGVRGIWAPDIAFFNGQYHLYYSVSKFGKNDSAIGLVTNKTLDPTSPDYEWVDHGMVIRSTPEDNFNAIDANVIVQNEQTVWLCWGSFWSGVKMKRIDPKTGKPFTDDTALFSLASRPGTDAVEAPFIVKHGEYWYLFVSFDFCCKGAESTYKIMVGRSKEVTGPYMDRDNVSMLNGGGTLVIESTNENWKGPGHCSILRDPSGDYLVFHAYHEKTGRSQLKILPITWQNGWPNVPELH